MAVTGRHDVDPSLKGSPPRTELDSYSYSLLLGLRNELHIRQFIPSEMKHGIAKNMFSNPSRCHAPHKASSRALAAGTPSAASCSRCRTLTFCDRDQRSYLLTRIKVISTSNPNSQTIADLSYDRRNGSCGFDRGGSSYEYSITDITGSSSPGAYDVPGMQIPAPSHAARETCLAGRPPPFRSHLDARSA